MFDAGNVDLPTMRVQRIPGRPMLAIVIDDSRASRDVLRRMLVAEGFHVVEAGNGQEGLDTLAAQGGAALVVTDGHMPVLDGLGLARALRADPSWDETRLLLATEETDLHAIAEALEAGADDFLMKPVDADGLHEKLVSLRLLRAGAA